MAGWLLIVFAFCAWNMTGVANGALALLALLFLLDLPRAWPRLRGDPAFLLLLATPPVIALLALRAIGLFPDSARAQWDAVSAWSAPFAFVIAAWWLKGDERLIRVLLAAAALGLTMGVLRKLDWDQVPGLIAGERYDSAYPALVLGFLASLMLVGLLALRRQVVGLAIGGRPLPWLGWTLWALGVAVAVAFLVVSQARGSALALGLVALGSGGRQGPRPGPEPGPPDPRCGPWPCCSAGRWSSADSFWCHPASASPGTWGSSTPAWTRRQGRCSTTTPRAGSD